MMIGSSIIFSVLAADPSVSLVLARVLFALHALGSGALLWSVLYRLVHTSAGTTRVGIRRAFQALAVVALVALLAPLWGWKPDIVSAALVLAMAVTQITTSHYWRDGVPASYLHDHVRCTLRRRAADLGSARIPSDSARATTH